MNHMFFVSVYYLYILSLMITQGQHLGNQIALNCDNSF